MMLRRRVRAVMAVLSGMLAVACVAGIVWTGYDSFTVRGVIGGHGVWFGLSETVLGVRVDSGRSDSTAWECYTGPPSRGGVYHLNPTVMGWLGGQRGRG